MIGIDIKDIDGITDGYWNQYRNNLNRNGYIESDNLGDLNDDGGINISDIILLVNIIMDGGFNSDGDLNEDGLINISDIIQLINLIFN